MQDHPEEELIEKIREALEWNVMDEARFNREIVRVVIHEYKLELYERGCVINSAIS
jgi:hypothetical protein